ncbi:hypothetical protein ACH3XW_0075 [Acanthocheilonema viteae]
MIKCVEIDLKLGKVLHNCHQNISHCICHQCEQPRLQLRFELNSITVILIIKPANGRFADGIMNRISPLQRNKNEAEGSAAAAAKDSCQLTAVIRRCWSVGSISYIFRTDSLGDN